MKEIIKNKLFWIILIVVFLVIFSFIYQSRMVPTIIDDSEAEALRAKNDSLELVVHKLDSIITVNKIEYEKKRDSISTQSVDDDCHFFSKYVSKESK